MMNNHSDIKTLKALFSILKKIESSNEISANNSHHEFNCFLEDWEKLKNSSDTNIQKIYPLKRIFQSAKSFTDLSDSDIVSLIIPIERNLHQNITDKDFLISSKDHNTKSEQLKYPLVLILDSFRSAFNVGALFRTAEGFGVEKIYLTGYSPTPENDKVCSSALGAEKFVPWEYHNSLYELLPKLKNNYHLVGLETSESAQWINAKIVNKNKPVAFVLGNERFGLTNELLSHCHEVRKIPLVGIKNSLNVATAGALALYEWHRQNSLNSTDNSSIEHNHE